MKTPVCRFCGEEPDGDRYAFVDERRTRCNKVPCVIAWQQEYDREIWRERDRRRALRKLMGTDKLRRGKRRGRKRAA